jgi:hypothetical protein
MAQRSLSRRGFLILGGVSLAAAASGATVKLIRGGEDAEERVAQEALTRRVVALFPDREAAMAVGAAYLNAHPGEADERQLVRRLSASHRAWPRLRRTAEIRRLARGQARRDYAVGRMVAVDGWYLSRTEARLCALTTFA